MLENDDSNLQRKFGVHITSKYFQNNPILKSQDLTNPLPHLSTLKAYPKLNLHYAYPERKGTRTNFNTCLRVLSTRWKLLGGLL